MSDQSFPGQYGAMPAEPAREPARLGPPPPSVENAVKLMFTRAALTVLGVLVTLATLGALRDVIRSRTPSASPATVDAAVHLALIGSIVFGVVYVALYVLLALQVRKGKGWARIVTFVIAGLSVLLQLFSLLSAAPALSRVFGLLVLLVDLGVIVLLAMRPSSEYFRSRA